MSAPLRIGLVTGEFPPMQGGVGAFTQELGRALAARGHDITVITHREARPATASRRPALALEPIELPFGRIVPRLRRADWRDMNLIADVAQRFNLDVINIQYQAAAYNMRLPAVNFLPWRLRGVTRTVVTFHDLRVPYLFPKAGRLREWVVARLARSADAVIATNQSDCDALTALRRDARVARIPIGSNIAARPRDAAAVAAVRDRLGLAAADRLVGYFGFINPSKGADTLVAALADLPPSVHLLFLGGQTGASDPATNEAFLAEIRARIAATGVAARVHWTGFVADDAVSAHLHACDVMALPYRDGVSLRRGTLMAVLAHGRPLVTTAPQQPVAELAHGDNCWLTDGEPAALADAVRRLLADDALRDRLAAGAAALAGRFSWEAIAAETEVVYRQVLADGAD